MILAMGGGPMLRRDEVVLITGCSDGGIGGALALEFCDNGFTVVATSRSLSTMKSLHGHQYIQLLELDLLEENSIREAVESAMALHGRIDILVNNAGVGCTAPVAECPIDVVDMVYRTNCLGPVMMIQAVVPHMVAAGNGKIVNVGSIVSFAAPPFVGVYAASKAALHASTEALRLEMRPFGVDVMLLVPGAVKTGLASKGLELVRNNLSSLQIFKPYHEYLLQRAMLSHHPNATPAPLFAKKAVAAILSKRTPACYIYGFLSGMYSFLYYCPYWIRDWYYGSKLPKDINLKKEV
jgi:NAD(P)-dependent dehydrogenase (short-subunit alcohol dehydrogenase family)